MINELLSLDSIKICDMILPLGKSFPQYCRVFQSARKFQFLTGGRDPPAKSYKNIFQFMVDPRNPCEMFF